MAKRFVRNLILALSVFLIMAILVYTNVEYAEPVTDYVSFVVTTDFSFQPVLQKVGFLRRIAEWDLGTVFEAWPQATSGW